MINVLMKVVLKILYKRDLLKKYQNHQSCSIEKAVSQ